jgi:hypothetical protein
MIKSGLWLELEATIGFVVGLGLGSLIGQRTVAVVMMIVLEVVLTPILSTYPQLSASPNGAPIPEGLVWNPTAVQASAAVHETEDNSLTGASAGLGVDWIIQEEPSQASASVTFPEGLVKPTAVQARAAVHDTPDNSLSLAPVRVGVV